MHPLLELGLILLAVALLAHRARVLAPRAGITDGVVALGLGLAIR